jgi:hypothetical protein
VSHHGMSMGAAGRELGGPATVVEGCAGHDLIRTRNLIGVGPMSKRSRSWCST